MATFVLVPGGAHGGWCYQKVARRLRARGHEVHAPSLSGIGEHSHQVHPGINLSTHLRDVANLLQWEDLRDVVLVGHSYGGMVVTGAADLAHERVGKLVYLDAANPRNGQSLVDVAGPIITVTRDFGAVVNGTELVLLPAPGGAAFYGITDPADQQWADERLTGHPWACFEEKLSLQHEDELWAIPQFHIVCSSTVATRDPDLIGRAKADGRFWEIDTGHDLMITEPDFVADALEQVAAA